MGVLQVQLTCCLWERKKVEHRRKLVINLSSERESRSNRTYSLVETKKRWGTRKNEPKKQLKKLVNLKRIRPEGTYLEHSLRPPHKALWPSWRPRHGPGPPRHTNEQLRWPPGSRPAEQKWWRSSSSLRIQGVLFNLKLLYSFEEDSAGFQNFWSRSNSLKVWNGVLPSVSRLLL